MESQKIPTKNQSEEENPILINLQGEIEKLTEEIKILLSNEKLNQEVLNGKVRSLIKQQTKFHNIKELYFEENQLTADFKPEQKSQSIQYKIQMIQKESEKYEPTPDQITQKREAMQEQMNEDNNDNWTDATQSDAGTLGLGEEGMVVLDDDMLDQFLGKYEKQEDDEDDNDENQQEQKVDFDELEKEFVTGQQSNEDFLFGKHLDKFCVSVSSVLKQGLVMSGGGDDKLHFYKFSMGKQTANNNETKPQQQNQQQNKAQKKEEGNQNFEVVTKQKPAMIEPFKIVNHKQTIDLIDISFDLENVFSLTEKELICTNLKTLQTQKVDIQPPTQFTCHTQGGVFAIANGFNVEIFNIKGFKFYDSYCLDEQVNLLKWTLNGKQLVAACDNKLRIITPKTQQVTKLNTSGSVKFHEGEITTMSLLQNVVFTGCIDGYVFASNLTKASVIKGTPKLQATINSLCAAQNYLIVGPAKNLVYWYDSNNLKQLFRNDLNGSSTDIIQLATKNQYAVSDIQGEIHLFDKRSPMQEKFFLKAGNTVHKLWHEDNLLLAACEDGCVRGWDLRKYQY